MKSDLEQQSSKEIFRKNFVTRVQSLYGKSIDEALPSEKYMALGMVVRDYISSNWIQTNQQYSDRGEKQVYYFSIEFLLGRLMELNLINLGIRDVCEAALKEAGTDLQELLEVEQDAGLGNGGLGRLAACFLDSLAAMGLPGHGNGIRYRYGLFEQKIVDNYQVELPDHWLKDRYVWEYRKADKAVTVRFGGRIEMIEQDGHMRVVHQDAQAVLAVPYDVPVIGYDNNTVNTLRLWNAEPLQSEFDLTSFNRGDYLQAVQYQQQVEAISKILYPEDTFYEGRLLRLKQQYFFVCAGLQSILRRFKRKYLDLHLLPDKVAVHINDTHPAVAIPELMRLLMDEEGMGWNEAWDITIRTVSYTNHTILPEALESWPVDMFATLLPRVYQIVEEINRRYCARLLDRFPNDDEKIRRMAIIADGMVHMARLAVLGSYSVNGVAAIHTDILKQHLFHDFWKETPHKFNNKTNGITHRRWLLKANPRLSNLLTETIGDSWIYHPTDLGRLAHKRHDAGLLAELDRVKKANKLDLADFVKRQYGISIDPESIYDVHIKRIHAYKRQTLNILHVIHLYNQLQENPDLDMVPRTFFFGGKAAPSYNTAKQVIKLINEVADKVNNDQRIDGKLKIVFLENYSVSLGEKVFPAADVSEQISTASKEASGTGNMKFMMNGAVTIGTLDGANVEIAEEVGDENIFIFGLKAEEVFQYYAQGGYNAWDIYNSDARVRLVVDQIMRGVYDGGDSYKLLMDLLLGHNDQFFVLRDFDAYAAAQQRLDTAYRDREGWLRRSLMNIAMSGVFSSDRTIDEYAKAIWKIRPVEILQGS